MRGNSIFLLIVLVTSIFFCLAVSAQETMTIVTYYPAPFGVYRQMQVQGKGNSNIILGLVRNDFPQPRMVRAENAGIIMVDDAANAGDGHPQIQFQNQAFTDAAANRPDFSIGLGDDNNFWIIGGRGATTAGSVGQVGPGTVTFASRDSSLNPADDIVPGRIRVGEVWFCNDY